MKNIILILIIAFTIVCCDKDNNKISEIDKLPPATQTGANTFGCLLDGKAFTLDNSNNSFQCYYQIVDNEFYFYIRGSRYINNKYISVYLLTKKKQIVQNQEYDLYEYIDNNTSGALSLGGTPYNTSVNHSGKLIITKLDMQNQIVSGRFHFNIIDSQGKVHTIKNGTFDAQFTI